MRTPGYVYVLINQSMPGLVKVGRTGRDPVGRASELSSATGVATPFTLVFHEFFGDSESAEAHVHTKLERQGYRVASNREFFQADVSDVIRAVMAVPGITQPIRHSEILSNSPDDPPFSNENDELSEFMLDGYKPRSAAEEVYDEALEHYCGLGDRLQDYGEALRLFKQAAKLGSAVAYAKVGNMYTDGDGVRKDLSVALDYFKQAIRLGHVPSYGWMALIFRETGHVENESKAWHQFFIGLDAARHEEFEYDSTEALILSFLEKRVAKARLFSSQSVELAQDELAFVATISKRKPEVLKVAQLWYDTARQNCGEDHWITMNRKVMLAWASNLE